MTDKTKKLAYMSIIGIMVLGGLYYFFRDEPLDERKASSIVTRMAFSGSSLSEEVDGKRVWELTARVIEVDSKTRWIYLTDLIGVFYRDDGTKIDVTAKEAIVDPQTKNMEMSGGLFMKASDGPTFKADKGRYAAKEKRIFASGNIRATRDDVVLTANEFEADDKFEIIKVRGNAHVIKGGAVQ